MSTDSRDTDQPVDSEAAIGRRFALLPTTWQHLAELLQLPAGMRIAAMHHDIERNMPVLIVEGPALPLVPMGHIGPDIRPGLEKLPGGGHRVHWPDLGAPLRTPAEQLAGLFDDASLQAALDLKDAAACEHLADPRGCYRVRCQLGRVCVEAPR